MYFLKDCFVFSKYKCILVINIMHSSILINSRIVYSVQYLSSVPRFYYYPKGKCASIYWHPNNKPSLNKFKSQQDIV